METPNSFGIVVNNPNYVLPGGKGHNFQTVFSVCFDFPDENLELHWNGLILNCSYKYEVPQMIYDVLDTLRALAGSEEGTHKLNFGMDTVCTDWDLSWKGEHLVIRSNWEWAHFGKGMKEALNERAELVTTTTHFMREWHKLVELLVRIIKRSRLKIGDWHYSPAYLAETNALISQKLGLTVAGTKNRKA